MKRMKSLIRKMFKKPTRFRSYVTNVFENWKIKLAWPFLGYMPVEEDEKESKTPLTPNREEMNQIKKLSGSEVYIIHSKINQGVSKKEIAVDLGLSESDINRIIQDNPGLFFKNRDHMK